MGDRNPFNLTETQRAILWEAAKIEALSAVALPDELEGSGLVNDLRSASRKVTALKEYTTLAGAAKTTLHRLAETSARAADALSQAHSTNAALRAERDEARQIVRDIHWMAVRYADGRKSYAPSMCNDALRKAYDAGWLLYEDRQHGVDPQYARDGDGPGWGSIEARAETAEAELKRLTEENEALERHNQALLDKVSSEDCACAYDHPDDVCLGHSPKLKAAEARIKALEEALEPSIEHIDTLVELLKIIKDHWVDYDHVFSIAVDEADKFVSSQALSGNKE